MTSSGTTPSRPDLLVVIRTRPVFQHIACFGASVSVISQPRQRPQRQTAMLPVCSMERLHVCMKGVCVCVCVCVCVFFRCHRFCAQGGHQKQDSCHWEDGQSFLCAPVSPVSLSLSLIHTHMHTYTHKYREIRDACSCYHWVPLY